MSRRKNKGRPAPVVDRKAVDGGWYPLPAPSDRKIDVKHPPMTDLLKRRPPL